VYLHELVDGFEAERVIGSWMTFYSDVRPHSALGVARRPRPTARSGQRDGINLVYAATHHFGDPPRGIPARPFLSVSRDARTVILQSIVDHLAR